MVSLKTTTIGDSLVHEVEVSRSTERLSGEPDEAQVAFWLEFVLDRLESSVIGSFSTNRG